jgi:hypothetical protein
MNGSILVDLAGLLFALVVVFGVIGWLVQRRSPSSQRSRRHWINAELAKQEEAYPGGKFTDDEYLARLEALEDRWDDEHAP